MNGLIYRLTNVVNGKVYIGQTVTKLETRLSAHKRNARKGLNKFFITNAIAKYGFDSFDVEILAIVPVDQLDSLEARMITEHNSKNENYGYNLCEGGSGYNDDKAERIKRALQGGTPWNKGVTGQVAWNKGISWTEDVKSKMRGPRTPMTEEQRASRRKVRTPATPEELAAKELERAERNEVARLKRVERMTGETNPFFGRTHSADTKKDMSERRKGIESWNKGISPSEETKDKIAKSLLGNTPWNKGKKATEEAKLNQSLAHKGKVQSQEVIQKRIETRKRNLALKKAA